MAARLRSVAALGAAAAIGACGWSLEGLSGGGGLAAADAGPDGTVALPPEGGPDAPATDGAGGRTTLTMDPAVDDSQTSQDLTADGPVDWIEWTLGGRERCLPCVERIGALLANAPLVAYIDDDRVFHWSNGTPDAADSSNSGTYVEGVGSELDFTVDATPSLAVLTLHADTFWSGGVLTGQFPGGPPVAQTAPARSDTHDVRLRVHVAADPPQTVRFSWKLASEVPDAGVDPPNVALIAATLAPEP